jgi:conjugative transfer signal peptidase TraF
VNLRLGRIIFSFGCLFVATIWLAQQAGVRLNRTASMPMGLWHVVAKTSPYERADTAEACLPGDWTVAYLRPGNCPGGKEPVLKVIAAVAGDTVEVDGNGLRVNGLLLENTRPLPLDGAGRQLHAYPAGTYVVPVGEVWLVSQQPISFDSRYFGPIPASSIKGAAEAIWTWE